MRLLIFALVWLTLGGTATAQSAAVTPVKASRPLLVPPAVVRVDAGPRFPMHASSLRLSSWETGNERELGLGLQAGLTAGFVAGLHAGLVFLPLELLPEARYWQPDLHALYAPDRSLPLAIFAKLAIPIRGDFEATLGLPVDLDLGASLRLVAGPYLQLHIDPEVDADLLASAEFLANVNPTTFMGLEFALVLAGFRDLALPLQLFVGLTLPYGTRTLGDLRLQLLVDNLADGFDRFSLGLRCDLFFDV